MPNIILPQYRLHHFFNLRTLPWWVWLGLLVGYVYKHGYLFAGFLPYHHYDNASQVVDALMTGLMAEKSVFLWPVIALARPMTWATDARTATVLAACVWSSLMVLPVFLWMCVGALRPLGLGWSRLALVPAAMVGWLYLYPASTLVWPPVYIYAADFDPRGNALAQICPIEPLTQALMYERKDKSEQDQKNVLVLNDDMASEFFFRAHDHKVASDKAAILLAAVNDTEAAERLAHLPVDFIITCDLDAQKNQQKEMPYFTRALLDKNVPLPSVLKDITPPLSGKAHLYKVKHDVVDALVRDDAQEKTTP